jgi:hypothetical protein
MNLNHTFFTAQAKKLFEATIAAKSKDKWSQMLSQQATKYLKNGADFSMFELMLLTGLYEKV